MKCPSCGAETRKSVCEFCGSEMPRKQSGNTTVNITNNYYGGSRQPQRKQPPKKNNSMLWWVLGWIFFFPAPVMILVWRSKCKWSTKTKLIFTAVFWGVMILFTAILGLTADDTSTDTKVDVVEVVETTDDSTNTDNEIAVEVAEETPAEPEKTPEELYFEQVKHDAEWNMMPRDECKNVTLEDRTLTLELYLTRNDKLLERYSDISDAILDIKEGYDWWDTLVLDFGSLGTVTKTKDDLVDGHFEITKEDFIKE